MAVNAPKVCSTRYQRRTWSAPLLVSLGVVADIGHDLCVGCGGALLQLLDLRDHRIPPHRPVRVGKALGLGGGDVAERVEGVQHPHPAQNMGVTVLCLGRIAPNIGDHLRVGGEAVLAAGGTGSQGPCQQGTSSQRQAPRGGAAAGRERRSGEGSRRQPRFWLCELRGPQSPGGGCAILGAPSIVSHGASSSNMYVFSHPL